jgi:hypothetical protein
LSCIYRALALVQVLRGMAPWDLEDRDADRPLRSDFHLDKKFWAIFPMIGSSSWDISPGILYSAISRIIFSERSCTVSSDLEISPRSLKASSSFWRATMGCYIL